MYEFESELNRESSDLGMDDVANDIAQFEARSKQKPLSRPKPAARPLPVCSDEAEADRREVKNQVLCEQLYRKYGRG